MSERLTNEQLRAVARSFTEQSIEAAAVNEAIALRAQAKETTLEIGVRDGMINNLQARIAKLEAVLLENYDEINALRARVAKLEAALTKISTAARKDTSLWSASDPLLAFIVGVVDAALWVDKPGG